MKRIDIYQASKKVLQRIFQELEPILLQGSGPDKKRQKNRAMEEHGMQPNDWSRLQKGGYNPLSYAERIHRILRNYRLIAFEEDDGKIILNPGNPRLTTVLTMWGTNDVDHADFFIYHYTATQRPELDIGYTPEEQVRQALLAVNYAQKECCLFFFKSPKKEREEISRKTGSCSNADLLKNITDNTDDWVVARYHGNVEIVGSQLYLNFTQRVSIDKKTRAPTTTRHKGLVIFRIPNQEKRLRGEEVGNFAAIGPSSGICAITQCKKSQILSLLSNPNIKPKVRHLLVGSSYSYANHRAFYKLSSHKSLLASIEKYTGNYEAISLLNRYGKESINISGLSIKKDGKVVLSTPQMSEITGQVFQLSKFSGDHANFKREKKSEVLSCSFDYSNKHDHHRMIMTIQFEDLEIKKPPRQSGFIIGTYTGLLQEDSYPQSGRILLKKTDSKTSPKSFQFTWDQLASYFPKNSHHVLATLLGFYDDLADHPTEINTALIDRVTYPYLHYLGKRNAQYYYGDYLLYYPSGKKDKVYQKFIRVDPESGNVTWYDRYDGVTIEYYLGTVAVIKKNLSIRFNEKVTLTLEGRSRPRREPMDRFLVFTIGSVPEKPKTGEGILGNIYRQDRDDNPVMSSAVIVPCPLLEQKYELYDKMKIFEQKEINESFPGSEKIRQLFE